MVRKKLMIDALALSTGQQKARHEAGLV